MKLFSVLYHWVMNYSRHRYAPYYLFGLSFAESFIFPIPPDVLLAPMALGKPKKAWLYAFLTTMASVLGGLLGYLLGMFFFSFLKPYIVLFGYETLFNQIVNWFNIWSFWIIFIAGFSPIPYKLFTITAGTVAMPLFPFMIASLISRGSRFFLVSSLMKWGGAEMEKKLKSIIDKLGWSATVILLLIYLLFQLYHYFRIKV
ncbi:MAG: hypothetical protein LEGION0398_MBIBDBAK_01292 [Legionellaceae bacterium]